jgi:1-pyrroline-5-carboxylate dehydrogenase
MQILKEAGLPNGVINFIPADGPLTARVLLKHKDLAGVHFTGSTATFQSIWKTVGENIENYKSYPRLVGETGGKDFIFAHASADLHSLSTALVRGAFEYQGQKCSAASRAYLPRSLWASVREKLISDISDITLGDVRDFRHFMNAVIDEKSFGRIVSYLEHAKEAREAEVLIGGQGNLKTGYFVEPTLIEAKDPVYKSMTEEIFGPVLTLYVYDESKLEETLEICDASTPYALTGGIFAQDRSVICAFTSRLRNAAGNFYINDKPTGAVVGQQPFGGSRASGTNDKAGSALNLLRWLSPRSIKETFVPARDFRYSFMGAESNR